jgi:hypothetical protein
MKTSGKGLSRGDILLVVGILILGVVCIRQNARENAHKAKIRTEQEAAFVNFFEKPGQAPPTTRNRCDNIVAIWFGLYDSQIHSASDILPGTEEEREKARDAAAFCETLP